MPGKKYKLHVKGKLPVLMAALSLGKLSLDFSVTYINKHAFHGCSSIS